MEQHASQKFFLRQRTPYSIVLYAINLYLSGLSLRQVVEELEKKGVRRSREAVRKWLKRFGIEARKTRVKKHKRSRVISLPNIELPRSLKNILAKLYASLEEADKPRILALKTHLTARQALNILNPKHFTSISLPNWCAFVKGKLSFREALEEACNLSISYYVEEAVSIEREKALKPRKARWGFKKRSFLLKPGTPAKPKGLVTASS